MKPLLTTFTVLFLHVLCLAQNVSYHQSHKEVEYTYGVIADNDLNTISEIEKIKYELRYMERSITKTIDENFQTHMDITIDSNGYEQSWMNLAKRFNYNSNGVELFDKRNALMKVIPYTDEEIKGNNKIREDIRENGFHPGLVAFPEFTDSTISQLATQGIRVTNSDNGISTVEYAKDNIEKYDPINYTITREWIDNDGYKNKETNGYMPYLINRGYLLRLSKKERFIHSVNGPCITDVRLKYYTDYQIQDNAKFIDKATSNIESIAIYPNPNSGVFSVAVSLPNQQIITSTKIINLISGDQIFINVNNSKNFSVNIPDLIPGNYILQVTTDQSTLSTHFFKQ